jgi:lysophospholipase L1-like esterase
MKLFRWLFLSLLLTACTNPPPRVSQTHAVRYLALGDSYTIGESVSESARWPVQLARALRDAGIDVGDPVIIARTGWTTGELSAAMDEENPQPAFGLVTLLIGVNNQYRGLPEDAYRGEFVALLKRSISLAGGKASHVVVLSIPDWGVTPYARQVGADPEKVAAAINRFNAINEEETKKAGGKYVNITGVSRTRKELVADDGLHPSEEMYTEWVKAALPVCKAALQQ